MSNYIDYEVWDEITYLFPNSNGAAFDDIWALISNFNLYFDGVMQKGWTPMARISKFYRRDKNCFDQFLSK